MAATGEVSPYLEKAMVNIQISRHRFEHKFGKLISRIKESWVLTSWRTINLTFHLVKEF